MAGRMSAAPSPSTTDQPSSRNHSLGATAVMSAPAPYTTQPMAKALREPILAPTVPPVIMKAAITSAYMVMATCTPLTVVCRSSAT